MGMRPQVDDWQQNPMARGDRDMHEYSNTFRAFSISQLARAVLHGSLTDGINAATTIAGSGHREPSWAWPSRSATSQIRDIMLLKGRDIPR